MNQRLITAYENIEEQNKEKMLNNEIEIDITWGKDIWGVTLQIDLDEKVRDQLIKYQEELSLLEPNNLLLLPRQYQHISFNQVVFWGGEYIKGRQETWESISTDFLSKLQKLNKRYNVFEITFSKLVVTTGGIIWCGYDKEDELENLRKEFLNKLPFPNETTKLNHIIHTTVARYKNKLSNPQRVLDFVQGHKEKVTMKVEKIILRKELVFPSIKTEDIASLNLKHVP